MKKYKMYIELCKKQKSLIALALVILVVNAIIVIQIPFALNNVINSLMNLKSIHYQQFFRFFILFVALYGVQQILSYSSTLMFKKIGNAISTELSEMLYNKIYFSVKKDPAQIEVGNVVVALDQDCFAIGENGILLLYNSLNIMINILGIFYFMWVTNPFLSTIITLVFIVLMIIQKKFNKLMEGIVKEGRVLSGDYTYKVQGLANNFEEYRRSKAYKYLIYKYKNNLKDLLSKRYKATKTVSLSSFVNAIGSLINITVVFLLGAVFILNNKLNLSNLITFNTYSSSFGGYLTQIPSLFMQIKLFNISYKRVCEILEIECFEKNELFFLDEDKRVEEVETSNLCFSYDAEREIISNLNKKFCKGNIYCISGQNGAGKTTLLNLLSGEYPIKKGSIKINGIETNIFEHKLNFDSLITYFSANSVLLNDSILNNITLEEKYDFLKIKKLAKVLCIDDWIENLPNGYDSKIDESNQNLSSGQKQKITIMRALMQNSDILIFDEFEKHLDEATKYKVVEYLQEIKDDKIIIITTHDNKIKALCDVNYVF